MKIKKGETYGEFLKRIRQTAKFTQDDLAVRLGFTKRSICAWERGNSTPSLPSQREIDVFAKTIK